MATTPTAKGVNRMWVTPDFQELDTCAEATMYAGKE
ncbi:MAG: pyrroloquinoline quinone precursor peptide PqqA [Firmicutes bacterium]|nr:pyrroloquinoline quinone precursor peptide PqqA [Bacillota bacterium]